MKTPGGSRGRWPALGWVLLIWMAWAPPLPAAQGILQIKDGYFWDPEAHEWFIPQGMAYQTWNPDAGANQSFEQMHYDLVEFRKAYANSVRCEFVWYQLETAPGVFDWSKPDELVRQAEALGLRLFVLIGFQWPPGWFEKEWYALNNQTNYSRILNYEHPKAREAYTNFVTAVTTHYKDNPTVAAWILGNEFAYYDLWEPERRFLGYDSHSKAAFTNYLKEVYSDQIDELNRRWWGKETARYYQSFAEVEMFTFYPPDRNNPGYHDLLQWRKRSIADFVAAGSRAARAADPHHLLTYSMVGALFGVVDAHLTCEDSATIVQRCRDLGAPLDFWSLNNYSNASLEAETCSTEFGVAKHRAFTGLPILVTETGHTSTEDLFVDAAKRQSKAVAARVWESLMAGAIGVHVFTWNDRDVFGGNFKREQGFGLVQGNRLPKTNDVLTRVRDVYRRFESIGMNRVLPGSVAPPADVNFFWSTNSDMGWPRANNENMRLWHVFKRLGYQAGILGDKEFEAGAYDTAPALLVSRGYQLSPEQLERLATDVPAKGIHIHANADFPGQFDAYHRQNPTWASRMRELFGLAVDHAAPSFEGGSVSANELFTDFRPLGIGTLGRIGPGYTVEVLAWKTWTNLVPVAGRTVLQSRLWDSPARPPALHLSGKGAARTAVTAFPLGEVSPKMASTLMEPWQLREDVTWGIYREHFGLAPSIELTGPGASYVYRDYRRCRNGSLLLSLYNGHTNTAKVALTATRLLRGLKVEDLTHGGVITSASDGTLPEFTLAGDDYLLLYAYASDGGVDESLSQAAPQKLWFESAPTAVWPGAGASELELGHAEVSDGMIVMAALESAKAPCQVWAVSSPVALHGTGRARVQLTVPDADLREPAYASSPQGGDYVWHAWLERGGRRLSETRLPVRLLWGVRPLALPETVIAGATYPVRLAWEELPSFLPEYDGVPLDRARLWDSLAATRQFCRIILELRSADQVVASTSMLTRQGSGEKEFVIAVPPGATGPFSWAARAEAATDVSTHDVVDGFEGRRSGALTAIMGPATFTEDDLLAPRSMVLRMKSPSRAVDIDFAGRLSLETKAVLTEYLASRADTNAVRTNIVRDFNQLIRGPSIYGVDRFAGIRLRPETQEALAKGADLVVANRLLMEDAYPAEWARNPNLAVAAPTLSPFAPWRSYSYPDASAVQWYDEGAQLQAAEGSQSGFLVITNGASTASGAGIRYTFPKAWALPAERARWRDYTFSLRFRLAQPVACIAQLQVGNLDPLSEGLWMEHSRLIPASPWAWHTLSATLDGFVAPDWSWVRFNPARVEQLVFNLRLLTPNSVYTISIDDIRFDGPDFSLGAGPWLAAYRSDNDRAPDQWDLDGDGIPDIQESGSGVFEGPANPGTRPDRADTDGDGCGDAAELVAGTNPVSAEDVLRIGAVRLEEGGRMVVGWFARAGRRYTVQRFEGTLGGQGGFMPVPGLVDMPAAQDGWMEVEDSAGEPTPRFYRLAVH